MPSATWKKSPADLVERFSAALPSHPDLVRKPMFGYPAAFVHGNMVCGLFQDSVVARLGKEGAAEAVAAGGATQFAPMPGHAHLARESTEGLGIEGCEGQAGQGEVAL